jgi:Leucine-rich repeat (LRR) protein
VALHGPVSVSIISEEIFAVDSVRHLLISLGKATPAVFYPRESPLPKRMRQNLSPLQHSATIVTKPHSFLTIQSLYESEENEDIFLCELIALTDIRSHLNDDVNSWQCSTVESKCSWVGISCFGGRITELRFNDWEVIGEVPTSIGMLSRLQLISFSNNSFAGPFPDVANLTNLHSLYLNSNEFTGTLPSWLGDLFGLQFLYLNDNYFSGSLPSTLSKMSSLAELSLSGNCLIGALTPIRNIATLRFLDLSKNSFGGPIEISSFSKLSSLYGLDLSSNLLTGKVLDLELPSLTYLSLADNQLIGEIPFSLSDIKFLIFLNLSWNNFGKSLYPFFPSYLDTLDLSGNKFIGTLPPALASLNSLRYLSVKSNQFSGSIPSWFGGMYNLYSLDMSNNSFVGSIPDGFWDFGNLQFLDVSQNLLTGIVSSSINLHSSLSYLNLGFNSLTDSLSFDFSLLGSLCWLDLRNNNFVGSISSTISTLSNLEYLS